MSQLCTYSISLGAPSLKGSVAIAQKPIAEMPIAHVKNRGLSLIADNRLKSNRAKALAESPVADNPIAH